MRLVWQGRGLQIPSEHTIRAFKKVRAFKKER